MASDAPDLSPAYTKAPTVPQLIDDLLAAAEAGEIELTPELADELRQLLRQP